MTGYETNTILPLTPYGELLIGPPAPNSFEADHIACKDIEALMARDPNVAATITAIAIAMTLSKSNHLGMVLAGTVNDGTPPKTIARNALIAAAQINNNINRHNEELRIHREKTEPHQKKKDTIVTEEVIQEDKVTTPPPQDIPVSGQPSIITLMERLTEETPELCGMVHLPRFAWEEVSASNLGTGIAAPNTMLCRFTKTNMALAA